MQICCSVYVNTKDVFKNIVYPLHICDWFYHALLLQNVNRKYFVKACVKFRFNVFTDAIYLLIECILKNYYFLSKWSEKLLLVKKVKNYYL